MLVELNKKELKYLLALLRYDKQQSEAGIEVGIRVPECERDLAFASGLIRKFDTRITRKRP